MEGSQKTHAKMERKEKTENPAEIEELDGLWEGHMSKIEATVPRKVEETHERHTHKEAERQ